jgi:hypothetical protein
MPQEASLEKLRTLIDALESEDAFERRDAIEGLSLLTQRHFEFHWRGGVSDRERSVGRWRRWLAKEEKRLQHLEVQSTVKLLAKGGSASLGPEALHKLLKALEPAQAKQLMATLLAKMGAAEATGQHPVCDGCNSRPATVSVTERAPDGGFSNQRLCEVCAVPRSR